MAMQFDHEKLDIYKVSLNVNRWVSELARSLRAANRFARDQLTRSALSITLNIAEGSGKRPGRDRGKFFDIARGSATECAATFDVLRVVGACDKEIVDPCKALLLRIVAMLTRMIESNVTTAREEEVADYGEQA